MMETQMATRQYPLLLYEVTLKSWICCFNEALITIPTIVVGRRCIWLLPKVMLRLSTCFFSMALLTIRMLVVGHHSDLLPQMGTFTL